MWRDCKPSPDRRSEGSPPSTLDRLSHLFYGFFVCVLVLIPVSSSAMSESEAKGLLREGEKAFRLASELALDDPAAAREQLQQSLIFFERLVRDGKVKNGRLYYNVGNAYFRLGDLGRAILYYRKSEELIGGDENLQRNLSAARSFRLDRIEPRMEGQVLRRILSWNMRLGRPLRMVLFFLAYYLMWGLAGFHLFRKRVWVRNTALFLALMVCPVLLVSLAIGEIEALRSLSGVIIDRAIIGRKGDSASYEPSFAEPLHAGTEFAVLEKRRGWLHIELADGRRCWIPSSSAETF